MEPSAVYAFNESFASTLFDYSSASWPNHETLYGNFFESHFIDMHLPNLRDKLTSPGTGHHVHHLDLDYLQEHAFGSSGDSMDFIESMNRLSTSSSTPEVTGEELDTSRLSYATEGGKDPRNLPSSSIGGISQQIPGSLPLSSIQIAGVSNSTSSPTRIRPRRASRTHRSIPSRNRPASTDQVDGIILWLKQANFNGPDSLVCPVRDCHHEQLNGRRQDFRRHVRTHLRDYGQISCKGVRWEEFLLHRHLFPNLSEDEQPYTIPEEDGLWIGGCLKTFSRADALKRHLKKGSCEAFRCTRDIVLASPDNQ